MLCAFLTSHCNAQVLRTLSSEGVKIYSLTITEFGYTVPTSKADIELLRAAKNAAKEPWQEMDGNAKLYAGATAVGMIVAGLQARRSFGSGGATILSCDNIPGNGECALHNCKPTYVSELRVQQFLPLRNSHRYRIAVLLLPRRLREREGVATGRVCWWWPERVDPIQLHVPKLYGRLPCLARRASCPCVPLVLQLWSPFPPDLPCCAVILRSQWPTRIKLTLLWCSGGPHHANHLGNGAYSLACCITCQWNICFPLI